MPEASMIPYGDALFPPLFISVFGLLCSLRLLPFIGLLLILPIAFFFGVHLMVIKGIFAQVLFLVFSSTKHTGHNTH